jgi:hypothetical protein
MAENCRENVLIEKWQTVSSPFSEEKLKMPLQSKTNDPGNGLPNLEQNKSTPPTSLKSSVWTCESVTGLLWKISLGEGRHFVALLIPQGDSKEPS